jgi:hypothetical protein
MLASAAFMSGKAALALDSVYLPRIPKKTTTDIATRWTGMVHSNYQMGTAPALLGQ